ncbi:MAG: Asd/ArgC dimerization domain-containing protein, partial [Christensenellaceae bacterium]
FPHPIFGNCLPQIDVFDEDDYTKEELKMIYETRKILKNDEMRITATTVRVPVFHGHSESINVEFEKDFDLTELKQVLANFPGIILMDDVSKGEYPMPLTVAGKDEVYIGRIRRDKSVKSGVNLWVVADNIRKGAATNAVQIAQKWIEMQENK